MLQLKHSALVELLWLKTMNVQCFGFLSNNILSTTTLTIEIKLSRQCGPNELSGENVSDAWEKGLHVTKKGHLWTCVSHSTTRTSWRLHY